MAGKSLTVPKSADELLEMYFLDIRCNLLETAAAFDRLQRAEGFAAVKKDPRIVKLKASLEILASDETGRAERFLELFSE